MFIFHCFDQNFRNCDTSRMVHKEPVYVGDLRGPGDVARWADRRGEEGEMPDWAKKDRHAGLDPLRSEVGTTTRTREELERAPRPVTEKAKESLKTRTKREIFDGRQDIQDWYVNQVKGALAKMTGDELYDFIRAHQSYEKKEGHVEWNMDFRKLVNFDINEKFKGANEDAINRRITAAMQLLLVQTYVNDVFQVTQKVINPWIYIDGRMGPYSVSVLNDYWMAKYAKDSKREPKPPGRAVVAGEYPKGSEGAKTYDAAMRHLDTQTSTPKPVNPEPTDPAPPKEKEEVQETGADKKVRARYAKLDTAGENYAFANLVVAENTLKGAETTVSEALAAIYKEDPKKAKDSPKTFRMLNLLARALGAKLEKIRIEDGGSLEVTADGICIIRGKDEEVSHEINVLGSGELAPPDKSDKEEPAEEKSDKSVEEGEAKDKSVPEEDENKPIKEEYARLDTAGDNVANATDLPKTHNLEAEYTSLKLALAEMYADKGNQKDGCVNRVMNLLVQKLGVKINEIKFKKGDQIEVTADGNFIIYVGHRTFGDKAKTARFGPVKIFST